MVHKYPFSMYESIRRESKLSSDLEGNKALLEIKDAECLRAIDIIDQLETKPKTKLSY
jgi:hypothetical protein